MGTKMEKIAQGFKDMTQDSNRMDKLFTDFMDDMRKPKGKKEQIEKMNEKRKYNLRILQINVKHIIGSFEALQKHSIEILDTIDKHKIDSMLIKDSIVVVMSARK